MSKRRGEKVIMAQYEANMAVLLPRSQACLGQKCHFLRQIGKSRETWRQTMLFVWWAALRLSVHLLTVKERRSDTSERSVLAPFIITETMEERWAECWWREEHLSNKRQLDFVSIHSRGAVGETRYTRVKWYFDYTSLIRISWNKISDYTNTFGAESCRVSREISRPLWVQTRVQLKAQGVLYQKSKQSKMARIGQL